MAKRIALIGLALMLFALTAQGVCRNIHSGRLLAKKGDREEEWKEIERARKKEKNPLPRIIDLMKKVRDRLEESDTGKWTQSEQRKIVEALTGQRNVIRLLEKLIKKAEEMQQSSSSESQGGKQDKQRQKQEKKKKEAGKKKQKERKDQGRKKKPVNPQNDKKVRNDDRRLVKPKKNPKEEIGPAGRGRGSEKWGDLPPHLTDHVQESMRKKFPPRWERHLEKYFKRLSK